MDIIVNGNTLNCSVLEYYLDTGLTYKIHNEMPVQKSGFGYAYVLAKDYKTGDEIDKIVYVKQVDENGFVIDGISYFQADSTRILLEENKSLRAYISQLEALSTQQAQQIGQTNMDMQQFMDYLAEIGVLQ